MENNGKGVRRAGELRAEKVESGGNNLLHVRFGSSRDYSINGFLRHMIRSTQEVLRPVAHSSGRHHGEVILRCRRWWLFDDRKKRSRWEWQRTPAP